MRKAAKLVTVLLCCETALWGASQVWADDSDRIQKLEDAIQQLQQQNQDLKHELDGVKDQQQAATQSIEPSATNSWATFVIPGAKDSKLVLGGYLQANAEFGDVDAYRGAFPDAGANNKRTFDRFRLRRARIGAWGDLSDYFDFKVMGDFEQGDGINTGNGGTRTAFSGTDLFINYHQFPEANLKVGQYDTPFGMEQFSIPDMFTLTPERSAVTEALRVERQIGVTLWGKPLANLCPAEKDLLTYWIGIYNGNNRNITVNDSNDFMYMARVEVQPVQGQLFGQPITWKIGIDGYTSRDATNTLLTQTGNALVASDGRLGGLSVQTANDRRWAGGIDQRLECGPFTLQGEYLQTQYSDALAKIHKFTANGYWVLGAYQIVPKKVDLVCKWEYFNPDNGLIGSSSTSDDIRTITGGVNWYIKNRATRDIVFMVDYLHTWSHFREVNPSFGRDTFDEIMTRLEFNF